MELVKGCGSNGIESMVHRVPDAIRTHIDEHPSMELDDCDYASSESDEVLPGTASGKLHRRKNRKVRLLTELLGRKDEKTNPTSLEDSPSSSIPDTSIGKDSVSASEDQVNFQENVTISLARRRKRKKRKDEEWMPGELMSSPNNGHKNPRTFNRGTETADEITSSDSEGTVNRSSSQTPTKGNLVNFKVDKSSIPGKKKNKTIQNSDKCPSLRPSRENLQKERQKKPGDTTKIGATDTMLYKSNDVSTGCGLDSFPESAKKSEKNSILLKKKSKMNQDHDWKASPIPCNNSFLRGPNSRKDVEIRQFGNVAVPLEVTQNAYTNKGLQFSLNTCLPSKRYDVKYSTPIRDEPQSLSAWQGRVLSDNGIERKDLNKNYVGEFSFPTKSKVDAYTWKGTHFDLNSNQTTYGIPFLNEKQKHKYPPEVGSCSLIQQMDFSGTSNNVKTVEFLDRATVAREHYDQHVEMASEQGAVDDIMEIAELMAKNQYERCLPDTKIGKQLPDTTSNTKIHQRVDLNKVYGIEEMNMFQETNDKLKTQGKNGRIGKFLSADVVGSSEQKSVNDFSHIDRIQCNMSQLEQSYSPAGFRPFPICGEKPLNGVQFSAINSIRQNNAQNFQWIGNVVGQKSSHATAATLGVCNICQSAPQQNREATHMWPSMIPNSMPYVHSIPHQCAGQVAKLDVLSHCPSSLPKGTLSRNDDHNFLNLSSNLGKNSRKFDSETLRRTHADHPNYCKHNGTRTLDLYSNDTIPAMHLLSLMDAGLQSGEPVDVDGNQRFIKKTSILPDHRSKEFPRMESGGYTTNSMKPPSFDCYGKSHLPQNFCECMSATAAFGPTSSFQNDKSFKKPLDFMGQLSHKSRGKEKKKFPDSQRQNKNNRSQKIESSNGGLNTTCGSFPAHSMAKMTLGTSDFTIFPKQRAMESAKKQKLKTHTTSGTFVHPKSSSENGICRINRNPANFIVPEAGNKYMIGGEDLKFGREATSSGLGTLVGHKRQRKLTVRKEHSRNQIS